MSKPMTEITREQMVEIREWLEGEKFIVAHDAFRKKHNKRIDAILSALEKLEKLEKKEPLYMHNWLEADAVKLDIDTEQIIQELADNNREMELEINRLRAALAEKVEDKGGVSEGERKEMVEAQDHDWLWMERDGVNPIPSLEMRDKIRALLGNRGGAVTEGKKENV